MSAPPPYTVDAGADPSKYPPGVPQGGYPVQPQAGYPPQPAYPQQYPQQPVAAQPGMYLFMNTEWSTVAAEAIFSRSYCYTV